MITILLAWLEIKYDNDFGLLYIGTIIIDCIGIAGTIGIVKSLI